MMHGSTGAVYASGSKAIHLKALPGPLLRRREVTREVEEVHRRRAHAVLVDLQYTSICQ